IFADDKTFLAETKACLVVFVAFGVVDEPLATRFSPQAADHVILSGLEAPHPAGVAMPFPIFCIDMAVMVERHEKIIPVIAAAQRLALLARQFEADVTEFLRQRVHGIRFPYLV